MPFYTLLFYPNNAYYLMMQSYSNTLEEPGPVPLLHQSSLPPSNTNRFPMAPYPQSPPLSLAACHPYPSPRSKSPAPVTQFKTSRKLPILKYPLTDITNFTLAHTTLQLSNLSTILAPDDEHAVSRAREIFGDVPPRKGRGKSRRGRHRDVHGREIGPPMSGGAILRSPIPLISPPRSHPTFKYRVARRKPLSSSPISHTSSHKSLTSANITQSRTPRRLPSVCAATPETPRPIYKRTKRWSSTSLRGNLASPPSPPSLTSTICQPPHSDNGPPDSLNNLHSPPPILSFPIPPSSAPAFSHSSPQDNVEQQHSLLPAMNLGSGFTQSQVRKKRTKRELSELQWQITMHKSLAWRITREHMKFQQPNAWEQCTKSEADPSLALMDLAQGGLRIAFEQPASRCTGSSDPSKGGKGVQLHWTDVLDEELVKRLWVKLIAQGCRTIPTGSTFNRPKEVPTLFPSMGQSPHGIPFPLAQPEQRLAPAVQLSNASWPMPDPPMGPGFLPRRRVSAMTFSSKTHPPVSLFNDSLQSSSPSSCALGADSTSSLTVDTTLPSAQCQMSWVSTPMPKGTLTPSQLTAQAILRHGDARSKPMRKGRPPGITQRRSMLRHELASAG